MEMAFQTQCTRNDANLLWLDRMLLKERKNESSITQKKKNPISDSPFYLQLHKSSHNFLSARKRRQTKKEPDALLPAFIT